MPENESNTIPIFELSEVIEEGGVDRGGRPVFARGDRGRTVRVIETSVEVLNQSMSAFVDGMAKMLAAGAREAGAYEMETVEVECQVSSSGKIGFAGTGVALEGGSSLRITFRKRPPAAPADLPIPVAAPLGGD